MKTIGIDIGTTTISAVVMDTDTRRVLSSKTIPNDSAQRTDKVWEKIQVPQQIIKRSMDLVDEIVGNYPDFGAIGLTGQMHGILYLDENGHYISPLYTWEDGRGNLPEFDGKSAAELAREAFEGNSATGYGLVTHLYNVRKKIVPSSARRICTVMDYLGMKLSGRKEPLMHMSTAASLGFFLAKEGRFDTQALNRAGIDPSILPEVTSELVCLGYFRGIPVTVAIGDNQASFLGAAGEQADTVLVNMGTGGQISVLSDVCYEAPGIEARPVFPGKYLLAGSSLCAGKAYEILERFFRDYAVAAGARDEPQFEVMEKLLQYRLSEERLVVQTTFQGTRTDPDKTGSITGMTDRNFTPADLVHGTLEGMAQELYDLYMLIEKGTGIHAGKVIASGEGLRRNRILQSIFQEKFHAPLELSPFDEEAACGAALTAVTRQKLAEKPLRS